MTKPNLILIEGYGTNSIILKGLIDFLQDTFIVHYFDLPGFIQDVQPLEKITVKNYVEFVRQHIDALQLEHYYIAGVSFGFLLANKVAIDPNCEGVLAIEPYINANHLNFNARKMLGTKIAVKAVTSLKLYEKIWHSKYFKKTLIKRGYPSNMITEILKDMNSREYFETGKLLVQYKEKPAFADKPYTLIVNINDHVVNGKKVVQTFKEKVNQLNIIYTNASHYPEKLDRSYFDAYIGQEEIQAIPHFFTIYKHKTAKTILESQHQIKGEEDKLIKEQTRSRQNLNTNQATPS